MDWPAALSVRPTEAVQRAGSPSGGESGTRGGGWSESRSPRENVCRVGEFEF